MTAAVAIATFQMIGLSKLEESTLNPRKHFDERKQEELNASVGAKGVLEPILVRPIAVLSGGKGKAEKGFEVVAGARRFRAAQAAKLKEVPCLVRDMTDVEALEVAILENVCREDISALDEGDAYRELVKLGQTVEQLVAKTGRPRTTIFKRIKLSELVGPVRVLVATGKLSASVGELIARLPTEAAQEAALAHLEEKVKYSVHHDVGQLSFRDAKDYLDDEFRLHLSSATFDVKDATLVPAAGACTACPKRTGADKETFHDVKADTCLDGVCWKSKGTAALALLKAEVLEKTGAKLVKESKLNNESYYGEKGFTAASKAKYSKPDEEVVKGKTWKDLLGDEVPKVVVLDGKNKTHNLVDKKKALQLLEAKDPKAAEKLKKEAAEPKVDDWEVRRAADEKKRQAQMAAELAVRFKVIAAEPKLEVAINLLISSWAATAWDWASVVKRAGLPKDTKADKLKPAQRIALILAQALDSRVTAQAAKLVKLDVKKLAAKALAAEPGTCFACGCTKEKQCKKNGVFCVDRWVDHAQATLCTACGGGSDED